MKQMGVFWSIDLSLTISKIDEWQAVHFNPEAGDDPRAAVDGPSHHQGRPRANRHGPLAYGCCRNASNRNLWSNFRLSSM